MKKIILAIPVAAPAIPPKPSTPAIIAIMKNPRAQLNITSSILKFGNFFLHAILIEVYR